MKKETMARIKNSIEKFWKENRKEILTGAAEVVVMSTICIFFRRHSNAYKQVDDFRKFFVKNLSEDEFIKYSNSDGEAVMLPHNCTGKTPHYWTVDMKGAAVSDILRDDVISKFGLGIADGWTPGLKLDVVDFIAFT